MASFVNGNELHIFCDRFRDAGSELKLYIRTGNLNIYEARFFNISVKTGSMMERDLVERYVSRVTKPELIEPLRKHAKITTKELFSTGAYPEFEHKVIHDGWVYSNVYNEELKPKFGKKIYRTTLWNGNNIKEVISKMPISDQTIAGLV